MSRGQNGHVSATVDPERGETSAQRADRNWNELLSELRVVQTGVTILFSLLLTVPFSARFEDVTDAQRDMYVVALLLSAASSLVLVAPVPYHRVLFRQRQKAQVVTVANALSLVGLALLALALTSVLLLVLDVVLGRGPAVTLAAGFGLVTLGLWFGPALVRRVRGRSAAAPVVAAPDATAPDATAPDVEAATSTST